MVYERSDQPYQTNLIFVSPFLVGTAEPRLGQLNKLKRNNEKQKA
jgi:hypothetical protein